MMSPLNRQLAPLSPAAWNAIDQEAERVLKVKLCGRKIVDFNGPLGWETSAIDIGRIDDSEASPFERVSLRQRTVRPLVEIRRVFEVSRGEMDCIDRGAEDANLESVVEAASDLSLAEDGAIFNGIPGVGIDGICPAASHESLEISQDYENYPGVVAQAISSLRNVGVDGPYAIALGPQCFTALNKTTINGFPVLNHVAELVDIQPVSSAAIDGAVVMTTRGGDFELTVGRDVSIGYLEHDSKTVQLYMDESFTFRVLETDAMVPLVYPN